MTTTTSPPTHLGTSVTEQERAARIRRTLVLLGALCAVFATAYLLWDVQGSWSYALDLRTRQLASLVVVGAAVGASSLVFQTIAGSRILTPGVMGFDSLYVLIQTIIVAALGPSALQLMGVPERFILNAALLASFGLVLFRWLFRAHSRNLFVLVLVGIVIGSLFTSLATFASRMLSPDDFLTLQSVLFASYHRRRPAALGDDRGRRPRPGRARALLRRLDVVDLGRTPPPASAWYHRIVTICLVVVTVLVATSTALVGPMLFLGLLVANLARRLPRPTGTPFSSGLGGRRRARHGRRAVPRHPRLRPQHDPVRRRQPRRRPVLPLPSPQGGATVIDVRSVSHAYLDGTPKVLDDVEVTFPPGQVTALVGSNGAGKSTLLSAMGRLLTPKAGSVLLDGVDIASAPDDGRQADGGPAPGQPDLGPAHRRRPDPLRPISRAGRLTIQDHSVVEQALDYVDMTAMRDCFRRVLRRPTQRAYIAMILAQDTDYVLLDEPLNNLDMRHAAAIMRLLRRTADDLERTVIVVLHDINVASRYYCDRIVGMRDGRIVVDGTPPTSCVPTSSPRCSTWTSRSTTLTATNSPCTGRRTATSATSPTPGDQHEHDLADHPAQGSPHAAPAPRRPRPAPRMDQRRHGADRPRWRGPRTLRQPRGVDRHLRQPPLPAADAPYQAPFGSTKFEASTGLCRPRRYTVRRWDRDTREMWIDFVIHGDEGTAGDGPATSNQGSAAVPRTRRRLPARPSRRTPPTRRRRERATSHRRSCRRGGSRGPGHRRRPGRRPRRSNPLGVARPARAPLAPPARPGNRPRGSSDRGRAGDSSRGPRPE